MQAGISNAAIAIQQGGDASLFFLYVMGIALTVGVVILAMLYGIRKLVLIPPKSQ